MKNGFRNCCVLLLLWTVRGVAQFPQLRFERQLLPSKPGPNRISPDVTLLSGVAFSDLRDLRFYDAAGKEIAYLLIPPEHPEPRWTFGKILPVAATKTTSGFEVDLGSAAPVDRLRLTGIPRPFLKRFRLEGSGDRARWTLLVAEGTLFDLPGEDLRMTEVAFAPGEFRYLRVTWDDRESGIVQQPRSASGRLVEARTAPVPLRAAVEFRGLSAGPGHSRFQVRLPGPHLPLAAVELSVNESRLLRTARVTENLFSRGEVISQTLGSAMLRRAVQGSLVAADLRIPIRGPEEREIEITVDDNNNPPLNLVGVTLEFGPQPWIYLESPVGAPIVARYGDSHLAPPKYDLEAIRQYVGRQEVNEARWGDARDLQNTPSAASPEIQPPAGAPIDPKPFRYSRKIPEAMAGLTALVLDPAVLAHSRSDLADLRIADTNNRQIPYLLEKREDVLALTLPPLVPEKVAPSVKQSHYRLVFPFENLPPAKLVLTTPERTFQRNISVQVKLPRTDPRSDPSWETVASANWHHNDQDTLAPPLRLSLRPSLGTTEAAVLVDDGDNRPLALAAARLELPLYRLRFFYPADGKLTLLYGQEGLAAPRYDLELLAPRLAGLSSNELALEPESAAPVVPVNGIQARVFWAALIVAVLVVLALLVRLLRTEQTR